ncbi:MAG: GNAT family N-acetyltransferase [Alphaproteobacteria bacterium]
MLIRALSPIHDRDLVDAFFHFSADYIRLERDEDPSPLVTDAFFTESPPGCDPATGLRLGLFNPGAVDPGLVAIAELAFGYPTATDAYLGLLLVAPSARGAGMGTVLLRHLEQVGRGRGMQNLYISVLEANPRARAFWQREGFSIALANQPITLGAKTQLTHRMGKSL